MARQQTSTGDNFDRRAFLGGVALGAVPALTGMGRALGAEPIFPGLITRQNVPPNLEFPFAGLDGPITPNPRFFVRCHFPIPKLETATWRLKIDGAVRQQLELSYDDLRKLPAVTRPATIECAGNGRAFLTPRSRGLLWELGAVSNAEWTGVPLAAVLEKAGLAPGAVEVVLEGADQGAVADEPSTPGPISYARSLPLDKARRPEVLLAYRMNGKDLPLEHGFPLRAVVSGWYGMASVKWLSRLTVTTTPYQGYWQTFDYATWRRDGLLPTLVPVGAMQVKAQIARPAPFEVVPTAAAYRVFGAAWAGESDVVRVEISADDGKTWQPAKLLGEAVPFAWRLWEWNWTTPAEPGRHRLMARATDKAGRTQPVSHDRDRRNYMIHHVLPIEVIVGG